MKKLKGTIFKKKKPTARKIKNVKGSSAPREEELVTGSGQETPYSPALPLLWQE